MAINDELLRLQIETGWVTDDRERLVRVREQNGAPAPLLVLATSRDGCVMALRSDVPDELAARLLAHTQESPFDEQKIVTRCERLFTAALGLVSVTSGPSYLIHPDVTFPSPTQFIRSSDADTESLSDALPDGSGWSPEEWRQLLEGALGPWVFAIVAGEVASICHSARLAPCGAEAGVWTRERFRGRGLAAAVTAAWASLLAPTGRVLFYSTSADNRSSQRVAARLNLRHIGSIWKFDREP